MINEEDLISMEAMVVENGRGSHLRMEIRGMCAKTFFICLLTEEI